MPKINSIHESWQFGCSHSSKLGDRTKALTFSLPVLATIHNKDGTDQGYVAESQTR